MQEEARYMIGRPGHGTPCMVLLSPSSSFTASLDRLKEPESLLYNKWLKGKCCANKRNLNYDRRFGDFCYCSIAYHTLTNTLLSLAHQTWFSDAGLEALTRPASRVLPAEGLQLNPSPGIVFSWGELPLPRLQRLAKSSYVWWPMVECLQRHGFLASTCIPSAEPPQLYSSP